MEKSRKEIRPRIVCCCFLLCSAGRSDSRHAITVYLMVLLVAGWYLQTRLYSPGLPTPCKCMAAQKSSRPSCRVLVRTAVRLVLWTSAQVITSTWRLSDIFIIYRQITPYHLDHMPLNCVLIIHIYAARSCRGPLRNAGGVAFLISHLAGMPSVAASRAPWQITGVLWPVIWRRSGLSTHHAAPPGILTGYERHRHSILSPPRAGGILCRKTRIVVPQNTDTTQTILQMLLLLNLTKILGFNLKIRCIL